MKRVIILFTILFSHLSYAEDGLIVATGFGAADLSKVPFEQQAKVMAKRAAQLDAQRNLVEQIKGLRLTGGTIMEDFEVTSDKVGTRVKAVLKGAFELDSVTTKDDETILVEVRMAVCVNEFHPRCKSQPTLQDAVSNPN